MPDATYIGSVTTTEGHPLDVHAEGGAVRMDYGQVRFFLSPAEDDRLGELVIAGHHLAARQRAEAEEAAPGDDEDATVPVTAGSRM